MAITQYHSLRDLEPIPEAKWIIKVQVVRKWKDFNYMFQRECGLNIIIIDENKNRMHCWVNPNLMTTFDQKLLLDETYEITNFAVTIFTGKYKCFNADKHIIISSDTTVSEVLISHKFMHEEIFEFTHFYDLSTRNFQDKHCIDVVGIVKKRKTLKCITNIRNEEQTILEFIINDTVSNVKVRLLDDFAVQCNGALNHAEFVPVQPIIIVLSSCKMFIDKYRSEVILSNGPATKFFINLNIAKVANLRTRYFGVDYN